MIRYLKLKKAALFLLIGVLAFIVSRVLASKRIDGDNVALAISGGALILGALLFLYPILFAKKIGDDGDKVKLKPIGEKDGAECEKN